MKHYEIYITPDAMQNIIDIYVYISEKSGFSEIAWTYIEKLCEKCHKLETIPLIGQERDDLRENVRLIGIDEYMSVAFEVNEDKQRLIILNVFTQWQR